MKVAAHWIQHKIADDWRAAVSYVARSIHEHKNVSCSLNKAKMCIQAFLHGQLLTFDRKSIETNCLLGS